MPNKSFTFFKIFLFFLALSIPAFSQTTAADGVKEAAGIAIFLENFFWYQEYLPQENIAELHAMRAAAFSLKENEDSGALNEAVIAEIHNLDNKVFSGLRREIARTQKDMKMKKLEGWDSAGSEIRGEIEKLSVEYAEFKTAVNEKKYPPDDRCLDEIEKYYALFTRSGYKRTNKGIGGDYLVKKGDYLRKIAKYFYKDESIWMDIYLFNKENGYFLPNPDNPDLILPGVMIKIPPLSTD